MGRAFKDNYDYYRLKKDCLGLKAGAIFYHDTKDSDLGSISEGYLKLAWDVDGNCNFGTCGDTYILHASARKDTDFLELVDINDDNDFAKIILDKVSTWLMIAKQNKEHMSNSNYTDGEITAYRQVVRLIEELMKS